MCISQIQINFIMIYAFISMAKILVVMVAFRVNLIYYCSKK